MYSAVARYGVYVTPYPCAVPAKRWRKHLRRQRGPGGLPNRNKYGEKALIKRSPSAFRTRGNMILVVTISVTPGRSKTSPHSADNAFKVEPWILRPVLAKSGTSVKPCRVTLAPERSFNAQLLIAGFKGEISVTNVEALAMSRLECGGR